MNTAKDSAQQHKMSAGRFFELIGCAVILSGLLYILLGLATI